MGLYSIIPGFCGAPWNCHHLSLATALPVTHHLLLLQYICIFILSYLVYLYVITVNLFLKMYRTYYQLIGLTTSNLYHCLIFYQTGSRNDTSKFLRLHNLLKHNYSSIPSRFLPTIKKLRGAKRRAPCEAQWEVCLVLWLVWKAGYESQPPTAAVWES